MKILLTNDDGIHADGLWALFRRLSKKYSVTVIAPDRERSAVSHGITLNEPLRATSVHMCDGFMGHAVNGTPADCIKLGLLEILDTPPDLVISGINAGSNVGVSINYSGTVAAAKEATLYGIASLAVSLDGFDGSHYDTAAAISMTLAQQVLEFGLPFGTLLNINIPNMPLDQVRGIRLSRQGVTRLTEYYEHRIDPRNRGYYWLGGDTQRFEDDPEIDWAALEKNFVSVTPVKCDMTDYQVLENLQNWDLDIEE